MRRASTTALVLRLALVGAAACGGEDAPPPNPEPPPAEAAAAPEPAPRPRGLWVLCEGSRRVLDEPARIDALLDEAARLEATDLFVQVYRGGRAWFDSTRADATPYRQILEATQVDTLAALLEAAHAAGLRVHAWVNVLHLARNAEAPIVRDLGPDAVQVDRRGRSLLAYPGGDVPPPDRGWYRMGTPGVWLDPAVPGVAERLVATFAELVERYPTLDGLHLDYIRYPDVLPFSPGSRFGVGLDFGYGEPSRARFLRETGREAPLGDSLRNANRWDAWRREQLTALLAGVRDAVRARAPGLVLSAAVWTYADRAYLALFQDWRGWLDAGLLDLAVPMTYTRDDAIFRTHAVGFARSPHAERIWIGIGAWLFAREPARAAAQVAWAREAGTAGEVVFSYDSVADAPALLRALAVPETRDAAD